MEHGNKNQNVTQNDDQEVYNDPSKMLEFTRKLLETQLNLTKSVEEKCDALKKRNAYLECQNDVSKAKYELFTKEGSSKDKNNRFILADLRMEEDMLKAQISSSILKAIVTPLEDEIDSLKKRLVEAETRLSVSYIPMITTFPEVPIDESSTTDIPDSDTLQGENIVGRTMELEIFCSELKKKLCESEIYIVALARQKENCDAKIKLLEYELAESRDTLNDEKAKSEELKQTWEKANEQFILESLNFQAEIKRLGETKSPFDSVHNMSDSVRSFKSIDGSSFMESIESTDKITLLQSEIDSLKLEIENQKKKYAELEESVPATLQESINQIDKSQNDFKNLDSFLVSIQEEFACLYSQLDIDRNNHLTNFAAQSPDPKQMKQSSPNSDDYE